MIRIVGATVTLIGVLVLLYGEKKIKNEQGIIANVLSPNTPYHHIRIKYIKWALGVALIIGGIYLTAK
jgi:hypothetical protein